MATLASGGRIAIEDVEEEILRLRQSWRRLSGPDAGTSWPRVTAALGAGALTELDRFELSQLDDVLAVCSRAPSLSAAGRILFAASRQQKKQPNDADRLRKYLARYHLSWQAVSGSTSDDA
jgi:transcriptional regulatory protein RtcR